MQFARIMNFLLDKAEHQEMPHQQLNSQGSLLQTAQAAAVVENQPMWRCQMSTVMQQSSPNNSQTVCMTQGCKVTECFTGVEHSENDVRNSLSVGFREPGNLNNTRCVVPQTSSEGREPHSPGAGVSRSKRKLSNHYKRNGTWCKKQTYRTPETGASNQVKHDERPRVKRNRGPKPKIMYDGNGPMQLWQFILSLLVSSPSERVVEWTRERKYEFRILEPDKLAELWGALKKKPTMTFLKLARGLRYYYGKSVLEKVRGKHYTYEFVMDIAAILGYDPVCDNAEDAGSSANLAKVVFPHSEDLRSEQLHVLDSARQREECSRNGEGLLSKGAGSAGIKLFDFSVLVESNETSSFYEAL